MPRLFNYIWNLSDGYPAKDVEKHELKVFGTFVCGGGSTMGYKLAGYNHLGGLEIDQKIAEIYKINHRPKYLYNEDIRDFVKRTNLPDELFDLDILDGSPPCSAFSMAGKRESVWGKEKVFREGQKKQTLDDLFFEYIKLADKLKPKICIAENVKGLIQENARIYTKKIFHEFNLIGYDVQLFLLNAASMGVPQMRERVFFIAKRRDLNFPGLRLNFNEPPVLFKEICDYDDKGNNLTERYAMYWDKAKQGDSCGKFKAIRKIKLNGVCNTVVATKRHFNPVIKRDLNDREILLVSSFPLDYNSNKLDVNYLCGMSVPPVMTAQIAHQIYLQLFSFIRKN
jgi:DNA (cytosine-5)-methyltransferase 1